MATPLADPLPARLFVHHGDGQSTYCLAHVPKLASGRPSRAFSAFAPSDLGSIVRAALVRAGMDHESFDPAELDPGLGATANLAMAKARGWCPPSQADQAATMARWADEAEEGAALDLAEWKASERVHEPAPCDSWPAPLSEPSPAMRAVVAGVWRYRAPRCPCGAQPTTIRILTPKRKGGTSLAGATCAACAQPAPPNPSHFTTATFPVADFALPHLSQPSDQTQEGVQA